MEMASALAPLVPTSIPKRLIAPSSFVIASGSEGSRRANGSIITWKVNLVKGAYVPDSKKT
jgi:hypothetical protein